MPGRCDPWPGKVKASIVGRLDLSLRADELPTGKPASLAVANAPVAQLAEATVSNTVKCRFESDPGHTSSDQAMIRARPVPETGMHSASVVGCQMLRPVPSQYFARSSRLGSLPVAVRGRSPKSYERGVM